LFHPVGDRFLVAQTLYLLDSSSSTGFFIFLTADQGVYEPCTYLRRGVLSVLQAGFIVPQNGNFFTIEPVVETIYLQETLLNYL